MDPTTYERILVPLDASVLAEAAVPHALAHALAHDAAVHLLQVIDPVDTAPALYNLADRFRRIRQPGELGLAISGWHEAAQTYLESVAAELREAGVKEVTISVVEGSPHELVGREAERAGCDLIVIATHGRSGLGRAWLGSVADHIVRTTPRAAVLVIRPPEAGG